MPPNSSAGLVHFFSQGNHGEANFNIPQTNYSTPTISNKTNTLKTSHLIVNLTFKATRKPKQPFKYLILVSDYTCF